MGLVATLVAYLAVAAGFVAATLYAGRRFATGPTTGDAGSERP